MTTGRPTKKGRPREYPGVELDRKSAFPSGKSQYKKDYRRKRYQEVEKPAAVKPPQELEAEDLAGNIVDDVQHRRCYSKGLAERICQEIAQGKALQEVCAGEDMPAVSTVIVWLSRYEEFREMYDEARILQADYLADEMLMLANKAIKEPKDAAACRVAADILAQQAKWRAPRKYSDKFDLNVTSPPKSPDQVLAEIRQLQEEFGIDPARPQKRVH